MPDFKKLLEERKKKIEEEFEEANKKKEVIVGQINELQKKFNQLTEQMIRLQGEYRTVIEFLGKFKIKENEREK